MWQVKAEYLYDEIQSGPSWKKVCMQANNK